jgi:DNA end-binding protein Ku
MYFADEIRPTEGIVPGRRRRVDKRELEMATTLIERFTTSFDHSRYEDEYRARLLKVIGRKRSGDDVHPPPQEEREAPSDLLAALRESVGGRQRHEPREEREEGSQAEASHVAPYWQEPAYVGEFSTRGRQPPGGAHD